MRKAVRCTAQGKGFLFSLQIHITGGRRLEERGMVALLQLGLTRAALHDYRLGPILDALFAANRNKVFSAAARKALAVR